MILAGTGHRPEKIGGFIYPNPIASRIAELILVELRLRKPEKVIVGMALGFDTMLAMACGVCSIPYIAAVPCRRQEQMWPEHSQRVYRELLKQAAEVVYTSPGSYSTGVMQIRNEWMVDHADAVLACWDGSRGGTFNCRQYAIAKGKPVYRIDPREVFR